MSCHTPTLKSLQEQGFRLTAQRALILENLFHRRGHRTAEEIFRDVSERLPGLNVTTVYRTLELLAEAGVVTVCHNAQGITEFELVHGEGALHHHLHCRKCGVEMSLEREPVERLRAEILERTGFHADLDHLVISGICAECAARSDAESHALTN